MIINREIDFQYDESMKVFSQFSPEIRNSFNSIIGISNLILDDDLTKDSNLRELIILIQSAAHKSFDLLDNLIQYYEPSSEYERIDDPLINVNSIIKQAVEVLKYQIEQKDLTIILNLDNYSEVRMEENLVNFIIRNLLSNAIKYSNNGGKIEIEYIMNSNTFDFSIERNSQSIVNQKNYFDEIIDTSSDSKIGLFSDFGSGVGLKLCQELIDNLNGKIKVEYKYGSWSKLNLMIPLNKIRSKKRDVLKLNDTLNAKKKKHSSNKNV